MRSDKVKNVFRIIRKNCFLPLAAFVFSFINIISCFVSPLNHSSIYELIANDIAGAKTFENTGLVKLELHKVEEDYNYLNAIRYYFDRIESLNRKGKSYVTYDNYQTTYEYGHPDFINLDIDYSIGFVDASSFAKLDFTINSGMMNPNDYSAETTTNHCLISDDYFYAIKGESSLTKDQVIGKTVRYLGFDFVIDGVVNNSSFASNLMHTTSNKFITFRYARINSKTAPYLAHIYFNRGSYFDNYSSMRDFFGYIYRRNGKDHLTIVAPNNEWIATDIVNFRALNGGVDKAIPDKTLFLINCLFSLLIGVVVGLISMKVFKSFSSSKKTFYLMTFAVFAYFAGLFIFGFSFNHLLLSGIHINVFTSFGCLFAILNAIIFIFPIFVCSLFGEDITKKELKKKPLVSVVIPVYNGDNYLASAISSVLNQSYSNIELIIVNDGSVDNGLTESIALSYADDRLHYYRKENGGVATALNYGIEKATGEYICWLSHDDLLPKDKILHQLIQLQEWEKEEMIIPYSYNEVINEGGFKSKRTTQYLFRVNASGASKPSDYFKLRHIIFSSLLVPKKFFQKNKFVNELLYSQDTFMFFQMLKDGYKLRYSRYGYINYRVHSNQGSFTRNDQIAADTRLQHKFFLDYFNETKDNRFISNCLMFYAKRAGGYECYNELFEEMISSKEQYNLSKLSVFRARVKRKVSSVLYNIKKKVLGR